MAGGHHEVLGALFQTCGTLHAVFLAFLVVAVWQSYDAARANVAEEASALATLYRMSAGMAPEMGHGLRKAVRDYVEAVVLSMSFFLFMEQARPQMFVTSIMASTIALLLVITFVLSRPFYGPWALPPEPFQHSLQVFDSVDETP